MKTLNEFGRLLPITHEFIRVIEEFFHEKFPLLTLFWPLLEIFLNSNFAKFLDPPRSFLNPFPQDFRPGSCTLSLDTFSRFIINVWLIVTILTFESTYHWRCRAWIPEVSLFHLVHCRMQEFQDSTDFLSDPKSEK